MAGDAPAGLAGALNDLKKKISAEKPSVATRKVSENALEVINAAWPETIGGSADLTGSNNTRTKGMMAIAPDNFAGRFIHYGIREHGMAAAMNGLALHGGVIPYSRNLPRVLRLLPALDTARSADGHSGHPCDDT